MSAATIPCPQLPADPDERARLKSPPAMIPISDVLFACEIEDFLAMEVKTGCVPLSFLLCCL